MHEPMDDREQASFVAEHRHLPHSEVARQLAARFGASRAWSEDQVRAWWLRRPAGSRGPLERTDPIVRAFILNRVGSLTLDELTAAAREAFGERAPSRSTIHRFVQQLRREVAGNPRQNARQGASGRSIPSSKKSR